MREQITINVPEGYEVAEGEQPRLPKKGEFFIDFGNTAAEAVSTHTLCIVLKKKAPKYHVIKMEAGGDYVEIKALEDALSMILAIDQTDENLQKYEALKELIK